MKKGVWVGGLVLSLGGWVSDLLAQDGPWRPASGPVPVTLKPDELKPCPAASIGRPVPVTGDLKFERNVRPSLPSGIVPASFQPSLLPDVKEITSGSKLPTWSEVDEEASLELPVETDSGGFASDRMRPVLPPRMDGAPIKPAVHAPPLGPSPVVVEPGVMPHDTTSRPFGGYYPAGPFASPGEPRGPRVYTPFADAPHPENPLYSHFYASAEYLLWWTKRDNVPPLVTTAPDGNALNNNSGFLDQEGTTVLFGGSLDRGAQSGFRFNAGYWLDTWCEEAVEIGGFFLAQRSAKFDTATAQNAVIVRPFFNVNANSEFGERVSFPGISTGRILIDAPSSLWGLDTNLRCNYCTTCDRRIDMLVGFRYLDLDESINIVEEINGLAGAPAPFTNARTIVSDRFAVHNQFYGGQIGMLSEWKRGPWSLELRGKLALGGTRQQLDIEGSQTIVSNVDNTTRNFTGGLLALPGNIGRYTQTQFSIVPEIGATLGYQITPTIRLYGGYNFLYWTNVIRPGDQIDRNLDVTKIPNFSNPNVRPTGQNVPGVPFRQSDYWAHGLVVGIEFRY